MADHVTPNLPSRDFDVTEAFYAKLGQRGVVHADGDARLAAVRSLQARQCRNVRHRFGIAEIHVGVTGEHRVRTVAHSGSVAVCWPSRPPWLRLARSSGNRTAPARSDPGND
ncbi:hypothetical protein ACJEMJ_006309, partial [Pseudomonas aeruginosa]